MEVFIEVDGAIEIYRQAFPDISKEDFEWAVEGLNYKEISGKEYRKHPNCKNQSNTIVGNSFRYFEYNVEWKE